MRPPAPDHDLGLLQRVEDFAVQRLVAIGSEKSVETLRVTIADPIRQVRTAAVASLVALAKSGPEQWHAAARDILVSIIRGDFSEAIAPRVLEETGRVPFIDASKMEDANPRGIRITREGEIVSADDDGHIAQVPPVARYQTLYLGDKIHPANAPVPHPWLRAPATISDKIR